VCLRIEKHCMGSSGEYRVVDGKFKRGRHSNTLLPLSERGRHSQEHEQQTFRRLH